MNRMPSGRNVLAAARRLNGHAVRTPLLNNPEIDELAKCRVWFKCENLQRSGSFKFRGAYNTIAALPDAVRRHGVITHSSGNHGAAVAYVARLFGIAATVVVPRGGSAYKRARVRQFGARLVSCGATLASREAALAAQMRATGARYVPPYDHPAIVAGQATVALELLADAAAVSEVWAPVGGGGLASGLVLGAGDRLQVVGAEPELASDAFESLRIGRRQPPMPPRTVADGLRTSLGELNFRILQGYRLPIKLVGEAEILAAQRLMMNELNVLVESSSAVPLAALLRYGPHRRRAGSVVVVITGGNVDPGALLLP